ncbi:alpha/beta hydrolase [Halosegnis sp.]|uniref:alpha/beta hydrolase n=1 Tax=Halosegnis sp. TaxID=2864959 RepID=UPI0035D4EF86
MAKTRTVESDDGTQLALHVSDGRAETEEAVVFVHGATFGSRPAFAAPGHSWLAACADRGRAAYAVDVRGYGDSERPAALDADPGGEVPVRAETAVEDLLAALAFARERHERLHLVGYSWGSMIAGRACERGADIASVTLYAPVYQPAPERVSEFELPDAPAPTRTATRVEVRDRWDQQLPKPERHRTDAAFNAFWETLHDGQGVPADEPMVEAPNGTLADLTAAAEGTPPYDAAAVTVPTLVVRGSLDRTATRPDGLGLYDALGADDREYTEIAGGSHFLALERRREVLFDRVAAFHDRQ